MTAVFQLFFRFRAMLLNSLVLRIVGLLTLILLQSPLLAAAPTDDRVVFEHMDTGFALRGAHEHLNCEQCHVRGIFKGTPRRCVGCHQYSTDIEASKKPPEHIPTTQDCDVCHDASKPNVSWQLIRINHAGLVGECAHCHNNYFVAGQPPNHVRTRPRQACDDCHRSTTSWANAKFDHTGITTGCAECHNNITAVGQPANHIPVPGVSCEICHSNTRFISFANPRMDHAGAGITNRCQRCHEFGAGYGITERPQVSHPSKAAAPDCATCHNTTTFDRSTRRQ